MKKTFFILPIAALGFTGCVVYQPSPTTGQYGYTYDYQLPLAEGIPAPVYSSIPEPRRTAVVPAVDTIPAVVDVPPPPSTPPIYSEIPEMTPRERVVEKRTTVYVPQQPIIQEGAGAQPGTVQAQPYAQPAGAPAVIYDGGNVLPGIVTNGIGTNGTTNGVSGTNQVGNTNQVGITNKVGVTNAFAIPGGGTNINEGAGAQPDIPNRLPPAPRLPEQPRLAPGTDVPVQQQPQQPGVPNPAANQPFSPAAMPKDTQIPQQLPTQQAPAQQPAQSAPPPQSAPPAQP